MNVVITLIRKLFNKNNREFVFLVALIIVSMLLFKSYNNNKQEKAEMEVQQKLTDQNTRALKDSITFEKTKNGEIEAIKSSFVSQLSDLKKTNVDLYNQVSQEKGIVNSLIKGTITAGSGSKDVVISNKLKKYPGGTYGLVFSKTKTDSGLVWTINGESKFILDSNTIKPGETNIYNNTMKLKLVLGFTTEKNGDYKVFARSGSSNVTFDDLTGVLIIPKKSDGILCPPVIPKKWGLSIFAGYGIGTINSQLYLTPLVGIGLSYSIIEF